MRMTNSRIVVQQEFQYDAYLDFVDHKKLMESQGFKISSLGNRIFRYEKEQPSLIQTFMFVNVGTGEKLRIDAMDEESARWHLARLGRADHGRFCLMNDRVLPVRTKTRQQLTDELHAIQFESRKSFYNGDTD